MKREAAALLERVGLAVPPTTVVDTLTPGQQQMVEIAKALAQKARILVLDEPTSSLTLAESQRLFAIVEELKAQGLGMIYISHRMDEIFRLADRITVLRDGGYVGDLDPKTVTVEGVVAKMVGRERGRGFPARTSPPGNDFAFVATKLVVPGAPVGVSFSVRRGEIFGFAGLVGAGRTELMQTVFGLDPALKGTMTLFDEPYAPTAPAEAIARGVYLAPEDRKHHGLVLGAAIVENVALPASAARIGFAPIRRMAERRNAAGVVDRLAIRSSSTAQKAGTLSGGNQQKVVLGKWLAMGPKVLILDEPTRGIDVGAKAEIYKQIIQLADRGITILLVSSEMEEILGLADRIAVLHERKLSAVLDRREFSEQRLMAAMTGTSRPAAAEA
jgi:ribose transport system ATP-binding protein